MKIVSRLVSFVVFCSALAGCASTNITEDKRNQIADVVIDPVVITATRAYYNGPENAWGAALGGVVGAVIASQALSKPEQIAAYMSANNIDLTKIVNNEFKMQLEARPDFRGKIKDEAKLHFHLEIPLYGLAKEGVFSSTYKPMLRVNAKLVDASGTVIWAKDDFVTNLNGHTPAYTFETYFQSPAAFQDAFTKSSEIIVQSVLSKF